MILRKWKMESGKWNLEMRNGIRNGIYRPPYIGHRIQLNELRSRDAPCKKQWKQEVPLAILSSILAQSCVAPLPEYM